MIAVSAIILLLILGAIITPYNIVFAKKHSNGGDNNSNDQKQKDDSSNGNNTPQDQPTNSGDQPPPSDGNPPTPPPVQTLLPVNPPTSKVDCSKTPDDPSCPPPKTVAAVDCIANPTDPSCPPPSKDCEPSYPSLCIPKGPPGNHNCIDTPEKCPPPKPVPPVDCIANPTDPSCPPPSKDCEPSYPSLCIPKGSSDIDCPTLEKRGIHDFKVIGSDPHGFDGDNDGIGCEDGHHNSGGNGNW